MAAEAQRFRSTFLGLNTNNKPVWSELDKWEYKVIPIKTMVHSDHFHVEKRPVIDDVQNDLNALGDQGWELVTIQDISLADGRMFTVAYLKRQR